MCSRLFAHYILIHHSKKGNQMKELSEFDVALVDGGQSASYDAGYAVGKAVAEVDAAAEVAWTGIKIGMGL